MSQGLNTKISNSQYDNLINDYSKNSSVKEKSITLGIIVSIENDIVNIDVGLKSFRKHLCWYSKSLRNSNFFRQEINKTLDHRKITSLINSFFED